MAGYNKDGSYNPNGAYNANGTLDLQAFNSLINTRQQQRSTPAGFTPSATQTDQLGANFFQQNTQQAANSVGFVPGTGELVAQTVGLNTPTIPAPQIASVTGGGGSTGGFNDLPSATPGDPLLNNIDLGPDSGLSLPELEAKIGQLDAEAAVNNTPDPAALTTAQKFNLGFQGLEALTGLFNAYQGFRALRLAEDQFDFAQDTTRANFANQAQTVNNQIQDRAQLRALEEGQRLPQAKVSADDFVNTFGVSGVI